FFGYCFGFFRGRRCGLDFFFFSSRRRHTRFKCDWSSDVCSSDLPKSRASLVLLMMALLAAGVATTLWLTTQAIADSYRLEQLRTTNAHLAEQKEQLQRDVAKAESPALLAPAAQQLGMVPGGDPARIVVGPDGKTSLVGEPKKAKADAPVVPAAPPAAPAAGTQS